MFYLALLKQLPLHPEWSKYYRLPTCTEPLTPSESPTAPVEGNI